MPKTHYTTVNGMLIGERTDGGNRIDYVPDALGSIVAAVDQNLKKTYNAAYKPYGGVLASTGTAPRFTWVGSLGYLASAGVTYAKYSVRARLSSGKTGGGPVWMTFGLSCEHICIVCSRRSSLLTLVVGSARRERPRSPFRTSFFQGGKDIPAH